MGKRKVFLLFLSAMSISIIIMVIIYGVFIKDIDFSFNVKNPESAPSPTDIFDDMDDVIDETGPPARVSSPADESADNITAEEGGLTEDLTAEDTEEITEVVPLEPQTPQNNLNSAAPTPKAPEVVQPNNTPPSLHYVYLDGFSTRDSAEQAIAQLQSRNLAAYPTIRQYKGQVILQFGVFSDKDNADAMAEQLRRQNVFVKVD